MEKHPRTAPFHHLTHHGAHVFPVAVYRAFFARALVVSETAAVKALTGVFNKANVLFGDAVCFKFVLAIQADHKFHYFFFFLYLVHTAKLMVLSQFSLLFIVMVAVW